MPDRFTRQRRLREVGDGGQARLAAARVRVADGDEAELEVAYLERAGVGSVTRDAGAPALPFAHAGVFRHAAARRAGAGAWRALRQIVTVLERAPS